MAFSTARLREHDALLISHRQLGHVAVSSLRRASASKCEKQAMHIKWPLVHCKENIKDKVIHTYIICWLPTLYINLFPTQSELQGLFDHGVTDLVEEPFYFTWVGISVSPNTSHILLAEKSPKKVLSGHLCVNFVFPSLKDKPCGSLNVGDS